MTVKACTHTGEGVCTYTHNENASTHTKTCLACGQTLGTENCTSEVFIVLQRYSRRCNDRLLVSVGQLLRGFTGNGKLQCRREQNNNRYRCKEGRIYGKRDQ